MMSKAYKIGQHVSRLVPCPDYDISGLENWLSDLAEEGLFLEKEGFFLGTASFLYQEPRKVKYRLEAVQKKSSLFDLDSDQPDPEQIELSQAYSWEYVAKYRNFFIYRSEDPSARELNTDPQVQALALNKVRKELIGRVFFTLVLFVILPLTLFCGVIVSLFVAFGSINVMIAMLYLCLKMIDEIRAVLRLRKVQKALKTEGYYQSEKSWRKNAPAYLIYKAVLMGMGVFLLFSIFKIWGDSITHDDSILLKEYTGELPFATIRDFAGEGCFGYRESYSGGSRGYNLVSEKQDLLADKVIEYREWAEVQRADGEKVEGILYVNYVKMKSPWLASLMAREMDRFDHWKKLRPNLTEIPNLTPLEIPEYSMDYQSAYVDGMVPTVIFQKENVFVRMSFYQSSYHDTVPLEEWTRIMAESLIF